MFYKIMSKKIVMLHLVFLFYVVTYLFIYLFFFLTQGCTV